MTDYLPTRYLRQIDGVISAMGATLTDKEVAEIRHLINHGEPPEGLRVLAWIIDERKLPITASIRRKIIKLCGRMIDNADLPKCFRTDEKK